MDKTDPRNNSIAKQISKVFTDTKNPAPNKVKGLAETEGKGTEHKRHK